MLPPEKHTHDTIWGHDAARALVPRLLGAGRLPHALLLAGPDGIGKRSLALAMAKAILSAGRPITEATLRAPSPAPAKRSVPQDPDNDDLFGANEADLFGGAETEEADLFGEAAPPEEKPAACPPPPPPPPPSKAPSADMPKPKRKAAQLVGAYNFQGIDARVARLVESSYPPEPDRDGRPTRVGHIDLTIVEPAGGRRGIVVDQIRFLQDVASIAPVEGQFRVIVILGADSITQEAGNCMLKLLEEPPSYLVMILVADRLTRVLPTIKSRCSVVPMAPLERETLVRKLVEEEKLGLEVAKVAAALSECRPGVALSVLQKDLLQRRRDVFEARLQLDRFGTMALPAAAARISGRGGLDEALWLLLSFTRDRMVRALAPSKPDLLVHGDALDLLDSVKGDVLLLDEEAERLLDAYSQLAHPYIPNQRAALETALWP